MDDLRALTAEHGIFLRKEALELGWDDATLRAARRDGVLHRVRQGCYCFGDEWARLDARERHLLLARSVLRVTRGPIALSHTTALLAHGVATWNVDLRRVHLTRLDRRAGGLRADSVVHKGICCPDDVVIASGMPAVMPARAVLESATILHTEAGLVVADSALHLQLCTPEELHRVFATLNHWRGALRVHVVLHHMDGRSANPGETRSRYMIWRHGLPAPEIQFEVRDRAGRLVAILDFAWPAHRAFGEFDGKAKYAEYLRPGETSGDAVFREKRREDLVRELTGWRGVRWTWSDLDHPVATCARIRSVLRIVA